jgi:hypothetical protein
MRAISAAEDPRLGYPLGVLWVRGMLCPAPEGFESAAEKDVREEEAEVLDKAGRLYAAQHYLVWRWQGSPCQEAPAHLELTIAEFDRPPTELDPEEFENARLLLKSKLDGARRALMRASPMGLALKAVDRICIDGFQGEIHPGPLKQLLIGLRTLKEHYDIRLAKSRDRFSGPDFAPPQPPNAAAPKRSRRARLPANLTSDETLRPSVESVAKAVDRLLGLDPVAA